MGLCVAKHKRVVISWPWQRASWTSARALGSNTITKEESVTVQMDQRVAAPVTPTEDSEFDLDITLLEVVDPAHLINMTDDGCGNTCEKSTCISAA